MWKFRNYCSTLCIWLIGVLCLSRVGTVPLRLFYPYGESKGDTMVPAGDDVSSPEIQLTVPVHFYDGLYPSIFVNSNGHLSFESELPSYQPTLVMPIGQDIKMISAFLSDIDISQGGNVFYRESTEEPILQRVAQDVQAHFSQFPTFEPLGLFIATWDGVVAYNIDNQMVNTFQIVIASDELNSFVIFNYLDDGIKWTKGFGKLAGRLDDPPAQAGFDSGTGRLHLKLPYSGTNQVQLLSRESNVNVPGVWMYHIGNTKGGNVQGPDLNTGDVEIFDPEVNSQTCIDSSQVCHPNSRCVDFAEGFCCECVPPTYGNGRQCIVPDQAQRLNGKISGQVNGVRFQDLDMHSFVVTKDGRAYTAISRVPAEISTQFMTLNTIGGVIGWMFALRGGPGAFNGYMFTGGVFNRTARITYKSGGEVNILQNFYGHDALNNIRMDTLIEGTVPQLETTDKITVDDYKEEYKKVSPGLIRSKSQRTFRVANVAQQYTWDQTIAYEECTSDPSSPGSGTMRLGVTRNFVVHDTNDNIVRFAMSNKISLLTGTDPCTEGAATCDENAECITSGNSFTCECRTGYIGDGTTCTDIDECQMSVMTCDDNASCYNTPGSFQCQCHNGYRGDGRTCTRDFNVRCGDRACNQFSRCVFNDVEQKPMCECLSGYADRDGTGCKPVVFACNEADVCDENAECIYNHDKQMYECECVEGFSGDGLYCRRDAIVQCNPACPANAECMYDVNRLAYRCLCSAGYTGDGSSCTPIDGVRQPDPVQITFYSRDSQSSNSYLVTWSRGFDGGSEIVYYIIRHRKVTVQPDLRNGRYVFQSAAGQWSEDRVPGTADRYEVSNLEADSYYEIEIYARNKEQASIPEAIIFKTARSACGADQWQCADGGCIPAAGYCDNFPDCADDSDEPPSCNRQACVEGLVACTSPNGEVVCMEESVGCVIKECDRCSPFALCEEDSEGFKSCVCADGYHGNGYQCTPYDCSADSRMCDVNAQCVRDVTGYNCRCNPGYRGDGHRCEAEGCDVLDNCDENARCEVDPRDAGRYICRCLQGYQGDGYVCIQRVVPCTQVDNCSEYGECVYDPQTSDHRCRCHRGYEGDGITCTPRGVDCKRDPRLCDPNASCMLNVDTFMCVCNANYRGDGRTCTAVADDMNYLLFSRGYSIHKVSYTQNGLDTDGSRVLYVPDELAIGVASDCSDQTFYWTDVMQGKISRANMDGFSKEVVVPGGIFKSPEGVAVDWLSRNLYVTDSALDTVSVLTINGTHMKTLISDRMTNPRGIVVDPQRGVMYWTDWYRDNPTIETANMDGSDRKIFVETDLGLPNGLTIDYYSQQVCWGDAGTNKIECMRADGVGRRVITEDAPYPFDLTLYGNTVYWSDWTINGVPSIGTNGGEANDALRLPVGGNGRLYGMAAVGEFCPRVSNACYRSYNGGCRYLCLPTPNGGRTCACPDGIDDVTCSEIGFQTKK